LKGLPTPKDLDADAYFWRPLLLRKMSVQLRQEFFSRKSDATPKPSELIEFLVDRATAEERAVTSGTTAAAAAKEAKERKKSKEEQKSTAAALATTASSSKGQKKGGKGGKSAKGTPAPAQSSSQQQQQASTPAQQSSSVEDCAFCHARTHWSRHCPDLPNLSIEKRWAAVKGARCPRCLRLPHAQGEACPFNLPCKKCGGAHSFVLCKAPPTSSSVSKN